MKTKKILSLLVAMTMLLSCVGITAMAEESATVAKIGETSYCRYMAYARLMPCPTGVGSL